MCDEKNCVQQRKNEVITTGHLLHFVMRGVLRKKMDTEENAVEVENEKEEKAKDVPVRKYISFIFDFYFF